MYAIEVRLNRNGVLSNWERFSYFTAGGGWLTVYTTQNMYSKSQKLYERKGVAVRDCYYLLRCGMSIVATRVLQVDNFRRVLSLPTEIKIDYTRESSLKRQIKPSVPVHTIDYVDKVEMYAIQIKRLDNVFKQLVGFFCGVNGDNFVNAYTGTNPHIVIYTDFQKALQDSIAILKLYPVAGVRVVKVFFQYEWFGKGNVKMRYRFVKRCDGGSIASFF